MILYFLVPSNIAFSSEYMYNFIRKYFYSARIIIRNYEPLSPFNSLFGLLKAQLNNL